MPDRRSSSLIRNSARIFFVLSLAVVVIAALPAFASDTTPPVLTGFTFSPMAINTSTSSATVTVTAQITDNLSGVQQASMQFNSPGDQRTSCGMSLISGTDLNGTWQCAITFPEYSEAGTWVVGDVDTTDFVGNYSFYTTGDLLALGFPTELQVTSNQDITPPVLTGFTFSPMAINTSTSSATVTVTAQITDNLSGVQQASMQFNSPGDQRTSCGMSLISGTDLNGTWQCAITFPEYSEAGTWVVGDVDTTDFAENYSFYTTSQLQALGFPTTLQVTSNQDITPPMLTGFTFSPMAINTSTSSATVTVTAQITDNLSGVQQASMQFNSPGDQRTSCGMSLISGTDLNGTWQCAITFPEYSEAGTWVVGDVDTTDFAENYSFYTTSQLQALGFPTTLIVDSTTTVTLTSSANPSAYLQSVTFTAAVTSSNGNTPTGTVNFYDGSTLIGTGTLNASAITTFSTSTLAVGTHSITAEYLGDANNPAGVSTPLSQVVNQAMTGTVEVSSLNPSKVDQPIMLTATVSGQFGGTPTGNITFKAGTGTVGTAALSGGQANLTYSFATAGTRFISAVYSGDTNFSGSTSPVLDQRVNKVTSTTSLASSPNPSRFGQTVTFTATVGSSAGLPRNGETVEFYDESTLLGTGTLSSGRARFETSSLSAGRHHIRAKYTGDPALQVSVSQTIRQVVRAEQ